MRERRQKRVEEKLICKLKDIPGYNDEQHILKSTDEVKP